MEKQAIIIEGNIFDGMNFHGPFKDFEAAIEWAESNLKAEWLIATMHQPSAAE